MFEKDEGNLKAILDSCLKIKRFTLNINDSESFYNDERTFDAVLINFIVIGEAVARLSNQLKEEENQIPWSKIKGFRNLVAHDYFGIDAEEVWQIIENDLADFQKQVQFILNKT